MNPMLLLPNKDEEILDTRDEDIIITTREGRIIKVTQLSGEHYGLSPSELLGQSVLDLEARGIFSPAITPEVVKKKKKVVMVQATPSGRKVLITGIPLFNDQLEVEFVISYSYDLSELIVMKEYLNDLESEMSKVKEELKYLRDQHLKMDGSVVESPSSKRAFSTALKMARFDTPVVIFGECGTGKSTLAKLIHTKSARNNGPLIEVNCSTLPEAVLEAAFIGQSDPTSPGYLKLSQGGTLVLKEVEHLSTASQSKLLKMLQQEEDIRIIALSEKPLEDLLSKQMFREDLFYYLNLASIELKPLRERPEDTELTIITFLEALNEKYQDEKKLSDNLFLHLLQLEWKGNFRELKNVLERSYIENESGQIALSDLPVPYQPAEDEQIGIEINGHTLPHILDFVEKKVLLNAQQRYKTTTEMAKVLGISQPSVVRKLKKYTNPLGDDFNDTD